MKDSRSKNSKKKLLRVLAGALGVLLSGRLPAGETPPGRLAAAEPGTGGARNLTLAPKLSFTDDSSSNFPIRGENLADGRIASDRPTAIFFGTAHCWNTNREAERFVRLYEKKKDAARFLVVDLDHPSPDQKPLIAKLYSGYIPTLAFLDRDGNVVYDRSGETARDRGDASGLEELLKKATRQGS